jgi:hypothetical protein
MNKSDFYRRDVLKLAGRFDFSGLYILDCAAIHRA